MPCSLRSICVPTLISFKTAEARYGLSKSSGRNGLGKLNKAQVQMAAQSVDPWRMPLECVRPSLFCTEPFVCNSGFQLSLRGTINGIGIRRTTKGCIHRVKRHPTRCSLKVSVGQVARRYSQGASTRLGEARTCGSANAAATNRQLPSLLVAN